MPASASGSTRRSPNPASTSPAGNGSPRAGGSATIDEIADRVQDPESGARVYAAARLAIDPDTMQERTFLRMLAGPSTSTRCGRAGRIRPRGLTGATLPCTPQAGKPSNCSPASATAPAGSPYCLVGGLALLAAIGVGGRPAAAGRGQPQRTPDPAGAASAGSCSGSSPSASPPSRSGGWSRRSRCRRVTLAVPLGQGLATGPAPRQRRHLWRPRRLDDAGGAGRGTAQAEDQGARDWTAWLLQQPFGQWLVGAVGLIVIGAGLAFAWKAWKGDVCKRLSVPHDAATGCAMSALRLCRAGAHLRADRRLPDRGGDSRAGRARSRASAARPGPAGRALWLGAARPDRRGLAPSGMFGLVQARYRRIDRRTSTRRAAPWRISRDENRRRLSWRRRCRFAPSSCSASP